MEYTSRDFTFLNCLCGSERHHYLPVKSVVFLNCLCGSERWPVHAWRMVTFLNCLCGSERFHVGGPAESCFLNCLCGSEQVNKTAVNRFDRIHPFYFLFYQSFIFFDSSQSLWAFPDFYH